MFDKYNILTSRVHSVINALSNKHCLQIKKCATTLTMVNDQMMGKVSNLNSNSNKLSSKKNVEPTQNQIDKLNNSNFVENSRFQKSRITLNSDLFEDEENDLNNPDIIINRKFTDEQYARHMNYLKIIKKHIKNDNLEQATNVLDVVVANNDTPSVYMINLLMRCYAYKGDVGACFRLYKTLRYHDLRPSYQIYTNLINSISKKKDPNEASMWLQRLDKIFAENKVFLNYIHYNVFIKVYCQHDNIKKALEMLLLMRKKNFVVLPNTCDKLLHHCFKNEEALKLSLLVWQVLRKENIPPTVSTYNLLLRNLSNTNLDLRVNDELTIKENSFKIELVDEGVSDLLATPPVVSKTTLVQFANCLRYAHLYEEIDIRLGDIHRFDKLALFGGYNRILEWMEKDNVEPNIDTFAYLIELANTDFIESAIINEVKKYNIKFTSKFFNVLMKRRCIRHDYDSAKNVLKYMETYNVPTNIVTWNILAQTCHTFEEIEKLIYNMDQNGFKPTDITFGTLFNNMTQSNLNKKFLNVINIMEYMINNNIKPSLITLEKMRNFKKMYEETSRQKNDFAQSRKFTEAHKKYIEMFDYWRSN